MREGSPIFTSDFFGETTLAKRTPDTGLTSIRVAKLGNAYTGQPPHEIGHLCGARPTPPGGGTPSISLIPPKAVVVVDVAELAHKPARLGVSAVHYRPTWSAHETG